MHILESPPNTMTKARSEIVQHQLWLMTCRVPMVLSYTERETKTVNEGNLEWSVLKVSSKLAFYTDKLQNTQQHILSYNKSTSKYKYSDYRKRISRCPICYYTFQRPINLEDHLHSHERMSPTPSLQ